MIGRIPTPTWLMNETVTIAPGTQTIQAGGSVSTSWSAGSVTVRGSLQPASSSESMRFSMPLGNTIYDLYLEPWDTDGEMLTLLENEWKGAQCTIGGVSYSVVGVPVDPITNGCVLHAVLERNDIGAR